MWRRNSQQLNLFFLFLHLLCFCFWVNIQYVYKVKVDWTWKRVCNPEGTNIKNQHDAAEETRQTPKNTHTHTICFLQFSILETSGACLVWPQVLTQSSLSRFMCVHVCASDRALQVCTNSTAQKTGKVTFLSNNWRDLTTDCTVCTCPVCVLAGLSPGRWIQSRH